MSSTTIDAGSLVETGETPTPYNPLKSLRTMDRALLIFLVIGGAATWHSPAQSWISAWGVVTGILHRSPYLAAAFMISAYLRAASVELLITRVFKGRPLVIITSATLFGALSPLCACTVVPVIAVLLRAGIPISAVMSFWVASPAMSPELYFFMGGILGFEFATVRLIAATVIGIGSGLATLFMERFETFRRPLQGAYYETETLDIGDTVDPVWKFWREPERRKMFFSELKSATVKILKWAMLAMYIESLMGVYLPRQTFGSILGAESSFGIILAAVLGVVVYLNDFAGMPLLKGLMGAGVSPGAAMAMSLTGAVTSIPSMMAVFPMVKRGVFYWYILMAVVFGTLSGYGYQAWLAY